MRRAGALAAALPLFISLAGCQTSNGADWSRTGVGTTSYRQAERTCLTQAKAIAEDSARREFFIGCMRALGWVPKPGATIEL